MGFWSLRATILIVSASTLPSCAVSNTTPARSTRSNSRWRQKTKKAGPCASARSAAAGAMTAWWRAFGGGGVRWWGGVVAGGGGVGGVVVWGGGGGGGGGRWFFGGKAPTQNLTSDP